MGGTWRAACDLLCAVKLSEAREGDVVRNRRNGSFYRYERPESNRTRIRPLELFPNGRLIPKSADTIVESGLEVDAVGRWPDDEEIGFFVEEEGAERLRPSCEAELLTKQEELTVLEAEMLTIDPNAHGGRGSHANKIKAVARRVESLEKGLAERSKDVTVATSSVEEASPLWNLKDFVQLPSGLPAIVLGVVGSQIDIGTKTTTGQVIRCAVDSSLLRPIEHRHLATV